MPDTVTVIWKPTVSEIEQTHTHKQKNKSRIVMELVL